MREELVRRNYAETTIRSYLHSIEDFRRYVGKCLDPLGPDDIRRYQVYLLEERKLGVGTAANYIAALRFFYVRTLKRRAMKEDLPYPHFAKHTRRLPIILSTEEMSRLIDSAQNLQKTPFPTNACQGFLSITEGTVAAGVSFQDKCD